jgi:hypothetical protein
MIQTQLGNYQTNGYIPGSDLQTPKPTQYEESGRDEAKDGNVQEVTWWGSSYGGAGVDQGKTPTATRYEEVEDVRGSMDNDGFFSPMRNESFAVGPQSTSASLNTVAPSRQYDEGNDDEDLGLGNNSNRNKGNGGEAAGGAGAGEQETKPAALSPGPAREAEKKTGRSLSVSYLLDFFAQG